MSKFNFRDLDDYENECKFKKKIIKKIKKNNFQDNFENKNSKKLHDIKIKNAHKLKDKSDEH